MVDRIPPNTRYYTQHTGFVPPEDRWYAVFVGRRPGIFQGVLVYISLCPPDTF